MARPKKDIDAKQVSRLARILCTDEEIAAVLDCSPDTLTRRFADSIKKGREQGRQSLRRKQYQLAMNGNPTMLVWLGKQYLGQQDRHEQVNAGMVRIEVTFRDPSHANGNGRLTHAHDTN